MTRTLLYSNTLHYFLSSYLSNEEFDLVNEYGEPATAVSTSVTE